MENMLHSTLSHTTVPSCFVFPPEHLKPATSAAVSLPLIDLSCSHDEVCRAILNAGKEFGFFQAGGRLQVMREMEAVGEEFFRLPAADKADFYSESEDINKVATRLYSSTTYETGGEKYWRD
ncbi:hypothetical protein C2845_PM06G29750 [Panicum miliaceum]|uniref:Non-haem dioxygenase N-terminal domain-containing protein n=1 Tax=Panicum miliaceum TaxID=4540 RepID=A0A3L6R5H5_PANMI|nr:hypothetical protein C2845_PM06G29750 [Panicum miliaceum]